MMSSDEMTERVLRRLNEHREKLHRRNAIIKFISFGFIDPEISGKRVTMYRKFSVAATVIALMIIITGTALLFSGTPDSLDEPVSEITEELPLSSPSDQETGESEETEAATEEETEYPENTSFRELELHEQEMRRYSITEFMELEDAARDDYAENGPYIIDREKYLTCFEDENDIDSMNTLEAKSYIKHLMLNSINYFNSVHAVMRYDDIDIELIIDLENNFSYERDHTITRDSVLLENEIYTYDDKMYIVNVGDKTYHSDHRADPEGVNFSDNDRYTIVKNDNQNSFFYTYQSTNIFSTGNTCICPQSLIKWDFDSWSVTGVEDYLGIRCAVIESNVPNYKMYIDLEHGFLLRYISETNFMDVEVYSIEIDVPVEKKIFDSEGYEKVQ